MILPNLRSQFPIFQKDINLITGKPLVYLDSGASSQKPQIVIDSMVDFYSKYYASSHGIHSLAQNITQKIEECREVVSSFIGSKSEEIVFTSGATDGINLVANGFLEASISGDVDSPFYLNSDSEILIWVGEHHSNILPYQKIASLIGCKVAYFGLRADGQMDMVDFESKLNSNTRLVAVSMASNVLGAVNPIGDICNLCQKTIIQTTTTTTTQKNAIQKKPLVMVDATQFVPHFRLDVREIDCDFLVFSGHKIYAPTGVGVLFAKSKFLEQISNYRVGGEMVDSVSMEGNIYKETPYRLEAGTSNFAGIIGLGTALEWFVSNESQILETEKTLFEYLLKSLDSVEDLEIYGSKTFIDDSIPLVSFNIKGVNALDLALMLDFEGICVRSGQHCTGLLHEFLGLPSSCRISLSCYNTKEEIDFIIQKIQEIAIKLKSKK